MSSGKVLTSEERKLITDLYGCVRSIHTIAKRIGRSRTAVGNVLRSRERKSTKHAVVEHQTFRPRAKEHYSGKLKRVS